MKWKQLSKEAIRTRIFEALDKNVNFQREMLIGIPGSNLDPKVFYADAPFLKDAPFLSALVLNPNHIGCHTTGSSESFFEGTHEIERELIELCATDILGAVSGECDGYVASGGTEANIQAAWIYRNFFSRQGIGIENMAMLASTDTHYSVHKAANVLGLRLITVPVDDDSRAIQADRLHAVVQAAYNEGTTHFIVFANMMTTMFGSVDDVDVYVDALEAIGATYRIHMDGAYGGFYYPFSDEAWKTGFAHPAVTSVTLDAHKMVQAPYGTGIFLVRKGYMKYATTNEASYVEGEDSTLIGSRSGANAIAVWMILMTYGYLGWKEKVHVLAYRTNQLERALKEKGVRFFRHPGSNIVTMRAAFIPQTAVDRFHLVPDNHHQPSWYKIVVMDHVTPEILAEFTNSI